jgi:hypothetical protein
MSTNLTTTLMSDSESIKSFYTSALLATPLDIISLLVQETSDSQNFVVSSSVLECLISATRCIRLFSCSLHYITTAFNSFSLSIFRRTHMISTGMSDINNRHMLLMQQQPKCSRQSCTLLAADMA